MTTKSDISQTPKRAAPAAQQKRVAVTGPCRPGRCRMLPLDVDSVSAVFVTHDKFREFLQSA